MRDTHHLNSDVRFLVGARCVLALFALVLTGCVSGGSLSTLRGDQVELRLRSDDGRAAIWRAESDRTLRFWGGRAVMSGGETWSGPMTDAEHDVLWTAVADSGLLARAPRDGEGDFEYHVEIVKDGKRHAYRVAGASPDVEPIRSILDKAAMRRHAAELEQLPLPGHRRQ